MLDEAQLNFDPTSLMILNIIMGIVLLGIALDLRLNDFKLIAKMPKEVLVGLFGQLVLLPALTILIIAIMKPQASIALGMILVASCPGGNLSNFMTHYAKGNTALSVTLTSISTTLAIFSIPISFYFWGNVLPETAQLMKTIQVPFLSVMLNVFLLIFLPLSVGLLISHKKPTWAAKAKTPMKWFSIIFFGLFVVIAFIANIDYFLKYINLIFVIVVLHNTVALFSGYSLASIFKIDKASKKAISLEIGLQNSGLALILIFNFFNGLGGMAVIAGLWGIWHIISGLSIATLWRKQSTTN